MAQLGRAQPYRPHLASGRVVAPGGPFIAGSTVKLVTTTKRFYRHWTPPKPHTRSGSPAPPTPLAVLPGETVVLVTTTKRFYRHWTPPAPHVARSITAATTALPVVAAGTFVEQTPSRRSFERRGVRHPLLPGPVVAPGGPVVPGQTLVLETAPRRFARSLYRPRLARPIVLPFVIVNPFPPTVAITGQASARHTFERRGAPKPHVFNVGFVAPPGAAPMPSLVRSGLFPRGQWKVPQIRLPGSLVVFSTPIIAGQTVLSQSKQRPLVGRTVPHPHLTSGIVAPGGVVIPAATIALVVNSKRTTQGRGGHLHLPPATLTQPPAVLPFPPAIVVGQSKQRMQVGRTTPRPHTVPGSTTPGPFRPGTFTNYSTRRVHIGRTTPRPHTTGPVVVPFVIGPNPVGPGLFISQAKQRMFVGRHVTQARAASPLQAAPVSPPFITFTAHLGDYRWRVSVSNLRWSTHPSGARWSSAIPQQRWTAGVTRYA